MHGLSVSEKNIKHNYSIPRVYAFMVRVEAEKKNLDENLTKTGATRLTTTRDTRCINLNQFNYIKCLRLLRRFVVAEKRKHTHLDAWQ